MAKYVKNGFLLENAPPALTLLTYKAFHCLKQPRRSCCPNSPAVPAHTFTLVIAVL